MAGYVGVGILAGLTAALATLMSGGSLLGSLASYSAFGSLGVLASAALFCASTVAMEHLER